VALERRRREAVVVRIVSLVNYLLSKGDGDMSLSQGSLYLPRSCQSTRKGTSLLFRTPSQEGCCAFYLATVHSAWQPAGPPSNASLIIVDLSGVAFLRSVPRCLESSLSTKLKRLHLISARSVPGSGCWVLAIDHAVLMVSVAARALPGILNWASLCNRPLAAY
jgi:hypothetical protein